MQKTKEFEQTSEKNYLAAFFNGDDFDYTSPHFSLYKKHHYCVLKYHQAYISKPWVFLLILHTWWFASFLLPILIGIYILMSRRSELKNQVECAWVFANQEVYHFTKIYKNIDNIIGNIKFQTWQEAEIKTIYKSLYAINLKIILKNNTKINSKINSKINLKTEKIELNLKNCPDDIAYFLRMLN